ncbi:protein CDKN2AIP homolog B [Xenopus laevis]|uniref:Protein CDKN2AIP homolog B n=1 Tax=Xenopus laevis TaxID=8355 RepID=CARFB_XENLA|nr:protein CDKN2AIP homolog B [Xenopus laevis]Q6PAV5.1 RecName: Full=Protein CDKN2AIP homolog B [Xenopus laevis]AAH60029.1 Cdkn2aip-b protein [Xenopus laevis]
MASEDEVSEFLGQNPETAAWLERVRGQCESDKLWRYRREFILRNLSDVCGEGEIPPPPETNHKELDRLLAYSMVWANHVFTGCRYPIQVIEKVLKMAENIKVTDAPTHTTRDELVAKVKKRGNSSSNEGVEELPRKKKKSNDHGARESSYIDDTVEIRNQPGDARERSSGKICDGYIPSTSLNKREAHSRTDVNTEFYEESGNGRPLPVSKAKSSLNPPEEAGYKHAATQGRKSHSDSRYQTAVKGPSQSSDNALKPTRRFTTEHTKERQPFFNRLYKTVAWKLVSAGGFNANLNHEELLNTSIESLKATLEIAFVPLKDLADFPQNKTSQENTVCELRCKSVYLGMGCGKTMDTAKAVAFREAVKLFLKKKVVVRICRRKFNGRDVEDLVLVDEEFRPPNLPPAVKNPHELV